MRRFTYKPAALRGNRTLAYDGTGLRHGTGAAEGPWRTWSDLTEVAFALRGGGRQVGFLSLTLRFGDATEVIAQTGEGVEDSALMTEIGHVLVAIGAARPEMTVALGETGGARVGMGVVGVLLCCTGLFLCAVAGVMAIEGKWGVTAAMGPIGLLAAWIGASLGRALLRGGAAKRVTISDLVKTISGEEAVTLSAAQDAQARARQGGG